MNWILACLWLCLEYLFERKFILGSKRVQWKIYWLLGMKKHGHTSFWVLIAWFSERLTLATNFCHCYFSSPGTNILYLWMSPLIFITYFCLLSFPFLSFLSFLGVSSWEDFDMYHELNFSLLMILFVVSFWKKIYFGFKEGTMENLLITWDEETWPYIILSLDCLIFREINSCNKFQWLLTLVISLFLSLYGLICCSDFPFVGFSIWRILIIIILFLNAFEEKRLRMKLLMKTLPDCPSVMFI